MNTNILKTPSRLTVLRAAAGAGAVAAMLALNSGCVVAVRPAPAVYAEPPPGPPGEVYVDDAPPAPVAEVIGVAPGPGFLWVGGYYHWYNGRWAWYRGHWARPPHPGAAWIAPRYEFRGGRRVYIAGYWR